MNCTQNTVVLQFFRDICELKKLAMRKRATVGWNSDESTLLLRTSDLWVIMRWCLKDMLLDRVLLLRHGAVASILANGGVAFFEAALPLAERLATASDRCSKAGPRFVNWSKRRWSLWLEESIEHKSHYDANFVVNGDTSGCRYFRGAANEDNVGTMTPFGFPCRAKQ